MTFELNPLPPAENGGPQADPVLPARWQTVWRWGAPILLLSVLVWLAVNAVISPNICLLTPGPGTWIVYPLPPETEPYASCELVGTFRRAFVLAENPATATVSWRCLTNGQLYVNGQAVPKPMPVAGNWKKTVQTDISVLLHPGTNQISVLVTNRLGPPALSLELKRGSFLLDSDETWETAVSGSTWRTARAASSTPRAGKGNDLYLLETTGQSFARCWPWLVLFGAISTGGLALFRFSGPVRRTLLSPKICLLLLAAIWGLLFLHNFPLLPAAAGFDAHDHLAYVSYIQEQHRLPKAREGAEMFHPPLFYLIGAKLLDLFDCKVFSSAGLMLLRGLSLVIGALNLALILAGLRFVFPGDWKKPLAGLMLAAFLPAQLCLLHYTTNETLSAMFVTGALGLTVRLLRSDRPQWVWSALLGVVLGLALMSKASALLIVPMVFGVLTVKLGLRRERSARVWLVALGLPLLLCLVLGSWHYVRLWRDYVEPTVDLTKNASAPWWQYQGLQNFAKRLIGYSTTGPWWQSAGLRTPAYYFTFGEALTRPFFSGFHGFWDAFYTTLWGDGLLGGATNTMSRPPWNYDFMTMGFVLALAPTVLVLTGAARALRRSFRAGHLVWLFLLGLGGLYFVALLNVSFTVPSYSQVKAFYELPVLLPFCALGALGFEYWSNRGRMMRGILGLALGVWLLNLYASFWIQPASAQTELASGMGDYLYLNKPAAAAFSDFSHDHPNDIRPLLCLSMLGDNTRSEEAVQQLARAAEKDPGNADIELALSGNLILCNRMDEAFIHAQRAAGLAPEDVRTLQNWCTLAVYHGNNPVIVTTARRALGVDPTTPKIHLFLAKSLMEQGDPEAIEQFSMVVAMRPAWPAAQFYLGSCLVKQPGKRDEGIFHLREAVRLDPANTEWQAALQNVLQNR